MSVITTTINITDRGPSLQCGHTIHVFVSSTPGHHRPSGREIGHISPTVGNKSHCCRNISLPRPETRGVCNSITLQPAVMHATSPAPPLSPLRTQDTQDAFMPLHPTLSILLGDSRHKINKTRCNIQHTGEDYTHIAACRRLPCCQWLGDRIWSSQQFYARNTSCVDIVIRKPGPLQQSSRLTSHATCLVRAAGGW